MSIDDIAYKHMFEIRKGANDYTSSQKKYIDWFDSMGYDLEHMDEHLRNDIKANVAASRYQYGTNKNPLPSSKILKHCIITIWIHITEQMRIIMIDF